MKRDHRLIRLAETAHRVFLLIVVIVGLHTPGNTAVETLKQTNVPQVRRVFLIIWV